MINKSISKTKIEGAGKVKKYKAMNLGTAYAFKRLLSFRIPTLTLAHSLGNGTIYSGRSRSSLGKALLIQ